MVRDSQVLFTDMAAGRPQAEKDEAMSPRWAAKVDANQHAIVKALRWRGASVHLLYREGRGCPDLLVGFLGVNLLMEVKTEDGELTEREAEWHRDWRGTVHIVRTTDEALDILEREVRDATK